jgi:hypothetical protein
VILGPSGPPAGPSLFRLDDMSDERSSAAVSADDVPIRYAIEGSSEPTLLFVHGTGHDQMLEKPAQFASALDEVLGPRVAGRAAALRSASVR